jgi:hypothetical protein
LDPVPVFERGGDVALEEVNGTQEVIGVGIVGCETESLAQKMCGLGIAFLRESDSGELSGKARVTGREPSAILKRAFGFRHAIKMGKRRGVGEILVSGAGRQRSEQEDDCRPVVRTGKLVEFLFCGLLRRTGKRYAEDEKRGETRGISKHREHEHFERSGGGWPRRS